MSISFLQSFYDALPKDGPLEMERLKRETGIKAREWSSRSVQVAGTSGAVLKKGTVDALVEHMQRAGDAVSSQEIFDLYANIFREAYSETPSFTTTTKLNILANRLLRMAENLQLNTTSLESVLSIASDHNPRAIAENLRRDPNPAGMLKNIGDQTRLCYTLGSYTVPGATKKTVLDRGLMELSQKETQVVKDKPLKTEKPKQKEKLIVVVQNTDTVSAAYALQKEGKKVALLSMANPLKPGGSFADGGSAQEEDLCRCSTLYHALGENQRLSENGLYKEAIPRPGVLYTPRVQFFRGPRGEGYPFLEKPYEFDVISAAGYDRRTEHVPDKKYSQDTEEMVRNILRAAAGSGNRVLVLGALGCGAFRGVDKDSQKIPEKVAKIFSKVLKEKEFAGVFEKIVFAIYDPKKETIKPFEKEFT